VLPVVPLPGARLAATGRLREWRSRQRGAVRVLVRFFLRLAFRVYFRRVWVRDSERVPASGPLLLVANHPNSLLDPGLLIHILDRPIHFGARLGLFATPLGPVLRALGAIPIVRLQDDPRGMRQNLSAIRTYASLLGEGRVTAIFPEGISQDSSRLAPLRNGAARIALDAEASQGFQLGLAIVPVGLQFDPRRRFRGEAFIRFGEPFGVGNLGALYMERPREAQRVLTGKIEAAMTVLAVHVEDPGRAWLVDRLSDVYLKRVRMTGIFGTGKEGLRGELRYRMAACLNYFSRVDPTVVGEAEARLRRYERLRSAAGVGVRLVEEPVGLIDGPLAPIQAGVEIALGFVPALAGLATSGVPYAATRTLARTIVRRNRHLPSLSSIQVFVGAIIFPLAWSAEIGMVWMILPLRWAVAMGVLLPVTGLFALLYVRRVRKLAIHVPGRMAAWLGLTELARVSEAHHDLVTFMDAVRRRYQAEVFGIEDAVARENP